MKATQMSINWGMDKEVWYIYTIGEGNGNPLQYSCLENPMDRGDWWAPVHGVAKSRTRLSNYHSLTDIYTIEYYSAIRPWCWERLKAGREGDDRGWDGWMPSLTRWTWVWVNSGSWWWTGRPGVLRFMGSQSRTWLSAWTKLKNYIRLKEQGDNRNQWIQNGGRSLGFCVSLCILNFILKVMSSSSRCVGCVVYLCEREWGEKRCYNIYIFKVNWSMNWKMQVQKKKDQLGSYHDTSFYTITMLRMGDG